MVVLFVVQPDAISWRWLPGAFLVVLSMGLLLRRDVGPPAHRPTTGVN
jgi:hypothetical protein